MSNTEMTQEQLKAEIARLTAQNERLRATSTRKLTIKIGEKGGISVYGLQRFPITLYLESWIKLFQFMGVKNFAEQVPDFTDFVTDEYNWTKLTVKEGTVKDVLTAAGIHVG